MKKYFRQFSFIIIFAIIFNATIPFLQSALELPEKLSNITGDKVIICTPNGLDVVSVGENGKLPKNHKRLCPLCMPNPASDEKIILPSTTAGTVAFFSKEIYYPELACVSKRNIAQTPQSQRDPPVIL